MMMRLTEFLDNLEEDTCEDARKIFREDYYGILSLSGYDLDFSKQRRYWTVLRVVCMHLFLISGVPFYVYSAFLLKNDLEAASLAINWTVVIILSAIYLSCIQSKRKLFIELHTKIARGIVKYCDEPRNSKELRDFNSSFAFQRKLVVLLAIAVVFINGLIQSRPIIEKQLGLEYPTVYDENGINRRLAFPLYLPFDTSTTFGHIMAVLFLLVSTGISAFVIAGTSIVFVTCIFYGLKQLKILICSVKDLPKRSLNLYCKRYNIDNRSFDKSKVRRTPEFQECIGECLRENIIHHQKIKEFMVKFVDIGRAPSFATIIGLMLCLGLTLILLSTVKIHASRLYMYYGEMQIVTSIVFSSLALAEFFFVVIIGYYGEFLLSLSEELRCELYFLPWYTFNVKNRKLLLTFQTGAHQPIGFQTWMFRLDRELISNILQTAYSLFNFMRLSETIDKEAN